MKNIPVIIVGGGPVGLSMALALARQDVHSMLVERHHARTEHPRARGVSMRTMELFRQWGTISELLKYEFPKEAIRFIWAESLQGNEVSRIELKKDRLYSFGPITASFVTQDCVEEFLHHTLNKHQNAEINFSKEMVSFEEDVNGVTVRLLDTKTNEEEFIRAQYLIAADGAHSRIRKQLGIEMKGPDNLGGFCNIYCEFDISNWTKHRPSIGFFFTDPKLFGCSIFTAYGQNRWIVGMRFTSENIHEDFTDDYCINRIREVLGIPDLHIRIINKNFWTMAAQVAKQYRHGRIFLIGDAAHRLPPTGGLGMNTGIQDVNNLAWKLAFVLKYHISDTLLDTYYDERAVVAKRNIQWSTENAKRFVDIAAAINSRDTETLKIKLFEQQSNFNYEGLDLGFIYHSKLILNENDLLISILPGKYIATTLPGSRAPHVELIKNGKIISTLDLFEKDYVLLVGADGNEWHKASNELLQVLRIPFKSYRVAKDGDIIDPKNVWQSIYEISSTGAVLVRPDGYVAWRSRTIVDKPESILRKIFEYFKLCKS